MCQLTRVILCARAFEEPDRTQSKNVSDQKAAGTRPVTRDVQWFSPLTNFESACGKSILPAVLIVLRVENSVFVFFWSDVLLPLFLTVAVFTTQPTVLASLRKHTEQSHLHRWLITVCFSAIHIYQFISITLEISTLKTRFYKNVQLNHWVLIVYFLTASTDSDN